MIMYRENNEGGGNNPLGNLGGIIILILFFVMLFFLAKGLFYILSLVAPFLIILSLFIDYTAILDFGKFIIRLFRDNILVGILAVLLTVVGFPIVAGFIFFRSIIRRKLKSITKEINKEQEFTDYEEVEEDEDFLELPEVQKSKQRPSSEYDDLFQ